MTTTGTPFMENQSYKIRSDLTYAQQTDTILKDGYGWAVEATPMDELRTVTTVRLVGSTFTGTTIDANFWTSTLANNGTAAQANGQISLGSSTTNNGSSILQTTRRARYVAGSSNRFRATIQLGDLGVTNNTRRWGMFDGTDGAYFELAGTTLTACVIKGTTRVAVLALSAPTTSATNYEIYITNTKVYFVVAGTLVATHTASAATWADTMNLPIRVDNINAGSTTNSTISVRVASIHRMGELHTNPNYGRITTAATYNFKYGAGMLHRIVLNNPAGTLITVYDDTAGTSNVLAIISAPAQANPVTLEYGIPFNNGLKVVSTGTWDATVVLE